MTGLFHNGAVPHGFCRHSSSILPCNLVMLWDAWGLEMEFWRVAQLPQQKTQVPYIPTTDTKQLQSTCTALTVVRYHSGCTAGL